MAGRWRRLGDRVPSGSIGKAVVSVSVVALVGIFLVQVSGGPIASPSASPGASQSAARPTASPRPPASPLPLPTPGASPEPWEDFELPAALLVAELSPTASDTAGVKVGSGFRLRSLDGTPAVALARGLQSQPAVALSIQPGESDDVAILTPAVALDPGATYRFRLFSPDGALGGSWAFQTQRPVHVTGTLPGDMETAVPLTTGIEVTFDQDGSTDIAAHFRIEPAVDGRFEQHGRTWAFVPETRLRAATAYRVTITRGVALEGSDQVLEDDVSFRFETARAGTPVREFALQFESPLMALRPSDRVALPIAHDDDDEEWAVSWPTSLPVEVYLLPNRAATIDAATRLTGPDSWLRASGAGLVPTSDLQRVARVDAPIARGRDDSPSLLMVPVDLDPGAYVVVVPRERGPVQALLQIRNLGAYGLSTDTRSVVWVHDLQSLDPVGGAVVATADGRELARTAADGLADFATPPALVPQAPDEEWTPWPTVISVTTPSGRWLVVALGIRTSYWTSYLNNRPSSADEPMNRWWLLLETDRDQYRQTDTIRAWGFVRERSDRSVPVDVELRLYPEDGLGDAPLARVSVQPTAQGVFLAELPIAFLPMGDYALGLFVGDREASTTWLSVSQIRKPSYRLDIATDRLVYLDEDRISVTIHATFFDGTPVPNAELRVRTGSWSDEDRDQTVAVTTDALGVARAAVTARYGNKRREGWDYQFVYVRPVNPEEGSIQGEDQVMVFPSKAWLAADAELDGTNLEVAGRLTRVDFDAVQAALADGSWDWDADPSGRPIDAASVRATVIQHVTTRRQVGTTYDYIEKVVVPIYHYDTVERTVGTYQATTRSDGSFHLAVDVPKATDDYTVVLRSADGAGRPIQLETWAQPKIRPAARLQPSYLGTYPTGCGGVPDHVVGLDQTAVLTLHDGDGRVADDGRFLFLVGARGLVDAQVSAGSTFQRTLRSSDLPGFTVRAVQVTEVGYTVADVGVRVDQDDMRLTVRLAPDHEAYRPGGTVTLGVTTLGPGGDPVAAEVVLQAVDEKLYAIGAAHVPDVLPWLMREVGDGFLQATASHSATRTYEGGCGATGGDGEREDFEDVVTFQLVRTGADGRGTATFKLSDDLTSWRLTATAISGDLRAGSGTTLVPVTLPFFVEAVLAPDYLVGEQPVLRLRGFGTSLEADDPVRYTVAAPSLGLTDTTVQGRAFTAARIPLPAVTAGDHRITITGHGPDGLTDTLVRVVRVVPSRLAGINTRYDLLDAGYEPPGGEGLTHYLVVDAGRGSLVPLLEELAWTRSARFDRALAAEAARQLLIDEFGFDPTTLPETGFDSSAYDHGLVALLPYGSGDLELTALAALVAPDDVSPDGLRARLGRDDDGEDGGPLTREARIIALAGLAALGDDVLAELRTMASEPLTVRERLWLALGIAASGDENGARAIERALLDTHGQRLGPWVRLEVGHSIEDTLEAAGLLLVLSARLGEPFGRDVARYLADHPSRERSFALQELAYAQSVAERSPRTATRFAWTVAGARHEVDLAPGRSFTVVLSAAQRQGFRLEPLAGELAVVSSWEGDLDPMPGGTLARIARSVTPAGDVAEDALVRVSITVEFGRLATAGCWQITDLVPSGLVPLSYGEAEYEDEEDPSGSREWPYAIEGQRVSWCMSVDNPSRRVDYLARVVSPGTFTWEPAIIQAVDAPEIGAATEATTFRIR